MKKKIVYVIVLLTIVLAPASAQVEITSMRTLESKTYLNDDGTFTATLGLYPIHYVDDIGNYQDINTEVIPYQKDGYDYTCETNTLKSYFGRYSTDGIKIGINENRCLILTPQKIGLMKDGNFYNMENVLCSEVQTNKDSVIYLNTFSYGDMRFIIGNGSLKCELELYYPVNVSKRYDGAELAIVFSFGDSGKFSIYSNCEKQVNDFVTKGTIEFWNPQNRLVCVLGPPVFTIAEPWDRVYGKLAINNGLLYFLLPLSSATGEKIKGEFVVQLDYHRYRSAYFRIHESGDTSWGELFNTMETGRDNDYFYNHIESVFRGYQIWHTDPIADNANIYWSGFGLHVSSWLGEETIPIDINEMSTYPWDEKTTWIDCGDGTQYVNDYYFEYGGVHYTWEFDSENDNFNQDIESGLEDDWFAIGLKCPQENQDDHFVYIEVGAFYPGEWPGRLHISYTADPPPTPTGLTATAVSSDQINLNWNDAIGEHNYFIERKISGETYSQVAEIDENITSWSDIGLSCNTTYYYRIRAQNEAGYSGYSNEASATTFPGPPEIIDGPTVGTEWNGLRYEKCSYIAEVVANGTDPLSYSWSVDGEYWGYDEILEEWMWLPGYAGTISGSGSSVTYTAPDIPEGKEAYTVKNKVNVDVTDQYGTTSGSTNWFFIERGSPPPPPPSPPQGLTASWEYIGKDLADVTLQWDPNTESDLAGYYVYRSTSSSGSFYNIKTVDPLDEPVYVDRVYAWQPHWYYVTAFNVQYYESDPSDTIKVEPEYYPGPCPFLYVWDGFGFIEDNNILASSGQGDTVADFYKLTKPLIETEPPRRYKLEIREEETEHSFFDMVSLRTIDHPDDVEIGVNVEEEIVPVTTSYTPLSAISGGEDYANVLSNDTSWFEGHESDTMIVEFGTIEDVENKELWLNSDKSGYPIIIEIYREGSWEYVASVFPRENFSSMSTAALSEFIGDDEALTLRLIWLSDHNLKTIRIVGIEDVLILERTSPLIFAFHSRLGNVRQSLLYEDGEFVEVLPGDTLRVVFGFRVKIPRWERSFVFLSNGYYTTEKAGGGGSQTVAGNQPIIYSISTYPNPAKNDMRIKFGLPKEERVSLKIYDVSGRQIKVLINDNLKAGYHIVRLDDIDLPSGIYFARLVTDDYRETKKLIVMR